MCDRRNIGVDGTYVMRYPRGEAYYRSVTLTAVISVIYYIGNVF